MITILSLPICRQVLLALLIGIWLCAFLGNTAYIVFSLIYCQHLNYTLMLTWQKNTTCVYLENNLTYHRRVLYLLEVRKQLYFTYNAVILF